MTIYLRGILARHVLKQVMIPFLCCFIGFLFLFLIGDLQDELSDMLKYQNIVEVLLYFLYILPDKIPLILPMSLLLGTMYSYSNMNRHNEISAIRSSGISVFKMSTPVFVFSLVMAILLFMSNEYLLGYFKNESGKLHSRITGKTDQVDAFTFTTNTADGKRLWNLLFQDDKTYKRITVSQNDVNGNPLWTIDAQEGEFSPEKGWVFKNGIKTTYRDWFPLAPTAFKLMEDPSLNDDPVKMRQFRNVTNHMTLKDIANRIESDVNFAESEKQILEVKYFSLIFAPFACMISVFLGIPLSINNQREGTLTSSAKALGIMILFYVAVQIFQNLGNAGHLPAFIAGAAPAISFLSYGMYLSFKK